MFCGNILKLTVTAANTLFDEELILNNTELPFFVSITSAPTKKFTSSFPKTI